MLAVVACSIALVVLTTLIHYETLRQLHRRLPRLPLPHRARRVVVMLVAFVAHAVEILVYGLAMHALVRWGGAGVLQGAPGSPLATFIYFSAETYTSLGFGDLAPMGPVRFMAGVEALNGLLLIGWTASFVYIAMERFWSR